MNHLGEDSQGFMKTLGDFERGFARICKTLKRTCNTLGRICKDLQDFGRGFARLWGRICKDSRLQDFGRGFEKDL